jgi:hypothetical protein
LTFDSFEAARGEIGVECDPFGFYLGDGFPVIWMWKSFNDPKVLEVAIANDTPGAFVYSERDAWNYFCRSAAEWKISDTPHPGLASTTAQIVLTSNQRQSEFQIPRRFRDLGCA